MPGLPARGRKPAVARAVVSPTAILAAGAGTAIGIAAIGISPVALLIGAAAWAARVALAVPRRPAGERIDPFTVGEPWRRFVQDALGAQRKFATAVGRSRPGPIRDRLQSIESRISDGVHECWRIARQGDTLDSALASLDERSIQSELQEVLDDRRRHHGDVEADRSLYRTQQAIESQLASAQRLKKVGEDAKNRLRLLNAQLDEAVARALEVSLSAGDVSQLGTLTDDVEGVVGELESLRQALEETSGTGGATATA
jgi:hypothetical protein